MKQEDYRACMSEGLKGKTGLSKEERKSLFCVESRLCSGKAQTKEEAIKLCSNTMPTKGADTSPSQDRIPPVTDKSNDPCACIISMGEWIQQPSGKECRPCLLGPVIQWYRDELQEKGLNDLATEVVNAVEGGEIALATKLDEIKDKVSPELKARLKEFDCQVQLYEKEKNGS